MTVAGRRAASTRRHSGFGRAGGGDGGRLRLAFSISASDGSKRSTSWTIDADLAGLLVVDAAAHEHDLVELRAPPSAAASAFSKTTISTAPSRSSSVANIIVVARARADLLGTR